MNSNLLDDHYQEDKTVTTYREGFCHRRFATDATLSG